MLKSLFALLVLAILVVGGYGLYLAKEVRVKFEGKRWAVPARVYARPLELYVGAPLNANQFASELQDLGYRKVAQPSATAQWSRTGNRFVVHTRPFRFWDEEAAARQLAIRFDAEGLAGLKDAAGGRGVDLLRLEPPEVGSIYPAHNEDRVLVRREDLPDHLVAALLAVEDRRFYEHVGVDPRGIARALLSNLSRGRTVQGGSTLTQQLVKNFFLTPERTLWRKFNEMLMALLLEARYDKDEILEAYANEIFLGQDGQRAVHGFGLASYFYFNRPVGELSFQESALLVALVKGASYYNPRRNPERAKARRDLVLEQMADFGKLSAQQVEQGKAAPLGITRTARRTSHRFPAFVDLVRRQLKRDYREQDLTSEGLRIFTTLDPWAQRQAQKALSERLDNLETWGKREHGTLEAAMVLVSAQAGEVKAVVGGRDGSFEGFNRALDAVRPIGSLVKPAVYLTALTQPRRYHLLTPIEDAEITLEGEDGALWTPSNFDNEQHGQIPLHLGLARSYNLATVRLGVALGVDRVIDTLQHLGLQREAKPYPSLLLGSLSLSPLEVAQLYQTIASGGFRAPLRAIRAVLTAQGEPLQRYPLEVKRVFDPGPVFLLNRVLVEVVREGTGRGLSRFVPRGWEAAGKTGTTNNLRDSWFAGIAGDLVGVVWVGRDDNQPAGYTGSSGALPIWGKTMTAIRAPALTLARPENVDYLWVDPQTGELSAEGCPGVAAFPFLEGSAPAVRSSCLERVAGPAQRSEDSFFGLGRAFDWGREDGVAQPRRRDSGERSDSGISLDNWTN